jgi:hypothetical protein
MYGGHNWEVSIREWEEKHGPVNILFTSSNSEAIKKNLFWHVDRFYVKK